MLAVLCLVLAVLLALVVAAPVLARQEWGGRLVYAGCALASAVILGLAAAMLLAPDGPAPLLLPLGAPWWNNAASGGLLVAPDELSLWFLLLLGVLGLPCAGFALGQGGRPPAMRLMAFPALLAAMVVTVAAGDLLLLLLGFGGTVLAASLLMADADAAPAGGGALGAGPRHGGMLARVPLAHGVAGLICLLLAAALLAGLAGAYAFPELRAAPPHGGLAWLVLLLVLLACGAQAGLMPMHRWLPAACASHGQPAEAVAGAAPGLAFLVGAAPQVALYALARLLLDVVGAGHTSWWGAPLVVLGGISALLGALRATQETEWQPLLARVAIAQNGLVAMALGLAAAFQGADLQNYAELAVRAGVLAAFVHGVLIALLLLLSGWVAESAGSQHLDRLGGLIRAMPAAALCGLVAVLGVAALPPTAGFAALWLLTQALLTGWRVGATVLQLGGAAAVAATAMATALLAAAMLRSFGLIFLGRPRVPRGLAAGEISGPRRLALLWLAAWAVVAGLVPGGLSLRWASDMPGLYQPLAIAAGLALLLALLVLGMRRASPFAARPVPLWEGGEYPPPAYLPYGDPISQPTAGGMSQPLRQLFGEALAVQREEVLPAAPGSPAPAVLRSLPILRGSRWPARLATVQEVGWRGVEVLRAWLLRRALALSVLTLVLLLALLAWVEAA